MHTPRSDASLTGAETAAATFVAFLAFAIVLAYFTDWAGLTIAPIPTLVASTALAAGVFAWLWRDSVPAWGDLAAFAGTSLAILVWLLWLAWPSLLPLGGGADLTHHLQLVDYLDRHWRLAHDPAIEAFLGEMMHYTPGAHLLASLAGRWVGSDGFHAVYPLVALAVSLKVGFVFFIARRTIGNALFGILAAVLLFFPIAFFVGSFTRFSYIAQVVSELFAVAMWWAVVAWDERPSTRAAFVFALSGVAAFLTWPVFVGPPLLVFALIVWFRRDASTGSRLTTTVAAMLPLAVVAAVHAAGQLGWAKIVRTDANMTPPAWGDLSWPFLALAAIGIVVALTIAPRGRTTAMLIAACAAQAAALYVLAKTNNALVPYMAIKMGYLAIYPLAVAAALAVEVAWQAAMSRLPSVAGPAEAGHYNAGPAKARRYGAGRVLAWASLAVVCFIVGRQTLGAPIQKPTVSEPLYQAGRWARDHADAVCVDYIVPDNHTAYWLHLAVVGNKRMSARSADDNTFVAREAILRWIKPEGLPYAVADLGTIPKDVLAETDEAARFGTAVVIKRRGRSVCSPD